MEFESNRGICEKWKVNSNDIIIFLIPVVVFLVYLVVFYPGIATIDSFNQLHQIASGHFTNWHPFFHTFIEMLCLKVYPSTITIAILQILVFATMWTAICKYNRNDCNPDEKVFKRQLIFTVIICIIPINALYSVTLWKDVLFSYFLMFLCFLALVMIDRKGDVDWKFIILISLVMAVISQLRGNGMYVALITVAIYALYLFVKKNKKMSLALVILTVTFVLLISSLDVAYDVEDNAKDAVMAKVIHMLADYDLNLEMEDSDRAKIHELIKEDEISAYYKPTGTDPILNMADLHHYKDNKQTYIGLAIKYSLKNPLHCLEYLFESSPMVWNIVRDHWMGRPYYLDANHDRLQSDFNPYYKNHNYTPTTPYENLSYENFGTPAFEFLNLLAMGIEGCILDTLFNNPATYMYLSFIALIAIHVMTRSKAIYLVYVPNLLNILMIFVSTPIQDYRYLYANLLVFYMLVIVLIGLRQRLNDTS
ncbi:MAG: hypothetical protein IJ287_08090 [Methanobrevibacter sp.]|nr:hypothetical protein [Methanobrevibacter sp.]